MHTAGPFGRSSSAVKLRPRAGRMPSVGRNVALDALAVQLLRIAVAGQREVVERRDADRRERRACGANLLVARPRDRRRVEIELRVVASRSRPATTGSGIVTGLQHQPVVDREQRGVRADPDGDRQHGDDREAGSLAQRADGNLDIGHGGTSQRSNDSAMTDIRRLAGKSRAVTSAVTVSGTFGPASD